jgi:hypothetical protein
MALIEASPQGYQLNGSFRLLLNDPAVASCRTRSADWLAKQLTQCTWCGCSGFRLGDYVLATNATCADGAQEYGVNAVLTVMLR